MAGRGSGATPAVRAAEAAGISFRLHEYEHDPRCRDYGAEAVLALGVASGQVFKTLVIALDGDSRRLGVAILPVPARLALKRAAPALGARRGVLAEPARAERATGQVTGGISPLGQRTALPMVLDESARGFRTIFVSAGRRGLEIELSPVDLCSLTGAVEAAISG
jgi:Cys-tRNA(Pro)/Cys-tRNA(Cys) deacylase